MTRVGLYLDLRIPPGARGTDVYARTLDRVAEAERRGLEAAWVTEHHGFADGYLPAPLTVAAAIAARTRTLRIGTGVVIAPILPVETLAEQAAATPDAPAIITSRGQLGYGELHRRAAHAADWLRRHGVGRNELVGLVMTRGPEQVVGIRVELLVTFGVGRRLDGLEQLLLDVGLALTLPVVGDLLDLRLVDERALDACRARLGRGPEQHVALPQ